VLWYKVGPWREQETWRGFHMRSEHPTFQSLNFGSFCAWSFACRISLAWDDFVQVRDTAFSGDTRLIKEIFLATPLFSNFVSWTWQCILQMKASYKQGNGSTSVFCGLAFSELIIDSLENRYLGYVLFQLHCGPLSEVFTCESNRTVSRYSFSQTNLRSFSVVPRTT